MKKFYLVLTGILILLVFSCSLYHDPSTLDIPASPQLERHDVLALMHLAETYEVSVDNMQNRLDALLAGSNVSRSVSDLV